MKLAVNRNFRPAGIREALNRNQPCGSGNGKEGRCGPRRGSNQGRNHWRCGRRRGRCRRGFRLRSRRCYGRRGWRNCRWGRHGRRGFRRSLGLGNGRSHGFGRGGNYWRRGDWHNHRGRRRLHGLSGRLRSPHRSGGRRRSRHLDVYILIQIGDILASLGGPQIAAHVGYNIDFILPGVGGFHRTDAQLYDLLVGKPKSLDIKAQGLALLCRLHRTPGH